MLRAQGQKVSQVTVWRLLDELGYSMLSNRKRREGSDHPGRDARFEFINATAKEFLGQARPVISVDTKKKELIGLDLLAALFDKVMLTPSVWEEGVIRGKALGAADAAFLERFSQDSQFDRVRLSQQELVLAQQLREEIGIGLGEAEVSRCPIRAGPPNKSQK